MRRIVYAGNTLLTSDEIASAVIAYSAQLARADTADTLVVPGVDEGGRPTELELLIGPASQMTTEPVDADFPVAADDFLTDLATRAHDTTTPRSFPDVADLRFYDGL